MSGICDIYFESLSSTDPPWPMDTNANPTRWDYYTRQALPTVFNPANWVAWYAFLFPAKATPFSKEEGINDIHKMFSIPVSGGQREAWWTTFTKPSTPTETIKLHLQGCTDGLFIITKPQLDQFHTFIQEAGATIVHESAWCQNLNYDDMERLKYFVITL